MSNNVVYFLAEQDSNLVKIGTTARASLATRVAALQCGNPRKLVLSAVLPGGATVENGLHRKFALSHVRGEWFRLDDDTISFIESARAAHGEPPDIRRKTPKGPKSRRSSPSARYDPSQDARSLIVRQVLSEYR